MNRRNIYARILVFALVVAPPAVAHESGVYESLEHIHIGRVFLSPLERMRLDRDRHVEPPGKAEPRAAVERNEAVRSDRAAGYIISSSGRAQIWKDGDFVVTDVPSSVQFPGHVDVTRTADMVPETDDQGVQENAQPGTETPDNAN